MTDGPITYVLDLPGARSTTSSTSATGLWVETEFIFNRDRDYRMIGADRRSDVTVLTRAENQLWFASSTNAGHREHDAE